MLDPSSAIAATQLAGSTGSVTSDLSIVDLFMNADIVVKAVMIVLLAASIWSWAIIFEKSMRLRRVAAQADTFERDFWSGGSLDALYDRIGTGADHPMVMLFASAMREWRRSAAKGATRGETLIAGVQQRIAQVMRVTIDRELEQLERYLGFLATVGSTAPFVGLFGTVWGIMNSFQSIALTKNTTLAVVAPGIAEALITTVAGLAVAIPAVIAFNYFTQKIRVIESEMESFSSDFLNIIETEYLAAREVSR